MHEAWQTELKSKGYPTQTRNIAISNGNHCAETQDYAYNASLLKMDGKIRTGVLTDIVASLFGVNLIINLAIAFDEPALLLGIFPGRSKFDIDFNAKALPVANTTSNIYKGKITFTKRVLFFDITLNITERTRNNPVNLSFDKYAGGRYELFFQLGNIDFFDDNGDLTQFQADILNALVASGTVDIDLEDSFGFIPTPSALDVGEDNIAFNNNDYFLKYNAANPPTAPKNIPFDNFITAYTEGSAQNERHISFNLRNGDWLATELDSITTN